MGAGQGKLEFLKQSGGGATPTKLCQWAVAFKSQSMTHVSRARIESVHNYLCLMICAMSVGLNLCLDLVCTVGWRAHRDYYAQAHFLTLWMSLETLDPPQAFPSLNETVTLTSTRS
jgi:hypothetical protein